MPFNISSLRYTLFTVAVALSFTSCHNSKADPAAANKPTTAVAAIEGVVAHTSAISQIIQVSGTLQPMDETVLMPEVSGRIIALNLPEGRLLAKGELIAKLYDDDLQAQLRKLQVQLQIAQTTEKRQKELLAINGMSQQDYDLSALAVSNLKADIEVIKTQISKTEIRAPYIGHIGLKKISLGAYVSPGTPLATIRADQQLKLDFEVPEKYSKEMVAGRPVTFNIEGSKDTFTATVMATEQSVDATTRNLKVRALVQRNSAALSPGVFADVKAVLGQNNHALMIPTQCIIPQARNKSVIVCKDGKAVMVKVTTGVRQAERIEITDGIADGDTIVSTGIMFIRPGMELKFAKINAGK